MAKTRADKRHLRLVPTPDPFKFTGGFRLDCSTARPYLVVISSDASEAGATQRTPAGPSTKESHDQPKEDAE